MRLFVLVLPVLLILVGCGSDDLSSNQGPIVPEDSVALAPSEDFYSFFNRFASDSAFQNARVALPLRVKLWDYSPVDSNLVLVELLREGWEFRSFSLDTNPDIPGDEWVRETHVFGPDASVEHRNRESGSPITFLFRLTESGWMLVELIDATV